MLAAQRVRHDMPESKEEREARFAADARYCEEQIAKIDAEYKAKGYDKIMPIEEMGELLMQAMEPILDAIEEMDPDEREKMFKEIS
jgi:hypothetical protein